MKTLHVRLKSNVEVDEDVLTSHFLSPYCMMGVAYDIWQDLCEKVEFKKQCKTWANYIKFVWSNKIYDLSNPFYKLLSDDDVYQLACYTEQMAKKIERSKKCLYNYIVSRLDGLNEEQKDTYATLTIINLFLEVSSSHFALEWGIKFMNLETLIKKIDELASMYLYQCKKDKKVEIGEQMIKLLNEVHKKVVSVKYEDKD